MENKHTLTDLYQMQALPLSAKIRMTKYRIRQWIEEYGEDGVYVSFSGGKDSTVLLHLVREDYPNVPAVFVDTGLEYPEIREFVKSFENVEWLRPKMNFKQVIQKYGYPFFSKETSECIAETRKYIKILTDRQTDRQMVPYAYRIADMLGIDRRENKDNEAYKNLKMGIIPNIPIRIKQLLGLTGEQFGSMYDKSRYLFMIEAPFEVSNRCCKVMKKTPVHLYGKQTGRKPFTAQMASESKLRTSTWIKNGCNAFNAKNPISNPMSFWTEQDVLTYIRLYGNDMVRRRAEQSHEYMKYGDRYVSRKTGATMNSVEIGRPICSVYGEVVTEDEEYGQMTLADVTDFGIFDFGRPLLKTTGCERTGCMFCGYGCHLEKSPGRFERMKITHPKQYEYIMKDIPEGGLGYKKIIDWINEHGNMNIKY